MGWLGSERHEWLGGGRASGPSGSVVPEGQGVQAGGDSEQDYGVVYVRPRCPRCGSERIVVRRAMPRDGEFQTKYHRCLECELRYKAVWE